MTTFVDLIKGSSSPVRTVRSTIRLAHAGWVVLAAAAVLSFVGIYVIDVASNPSPRGVLDLSALAWKQVVFLIIGLLGALLVALPHYKLFMLVAWPLAAISLALLLFLLVPGVPTSLVEEINGVKIKSLEDVSHAFKKTDEFYVIRVVGDPQPLVMEAKAVAEARTRILRRYRISQEQYLEDSILPEELTAKNAVGQ